MTGGSELCEAMMLVAYERLTDHGLALPLFCSSPGANALYIAVPSRPGDPTAHIKAFELYSTSEATALDVQLFRSAVAGGSWIDVFIWRNIVHVGTRAELWEVTASSHDEMERVSPLSLLALAEGVDRSEIARCAAVAYNWLAQDWGRKIADRWRVDSYLTRLARRDLIKRYSGSELRHHVFDVLDSIRLDQHESRLRLRVPRSLRVTTDDLPGLEFATNALDWRLEIMIEERSETPIVGTASTASRSMVMRLRHGRGRTQTQIPLRVVDQFFGGNRSLRDARTGRERTMTLSMKAGAGRNTMKLQLPEIAEMTDPVAYFERNQDGVIFELNDASSHKGRKIAQLLDQGLQDGSTKKTQRGATWWRVLPPPS